MDTETQTIQSAVNWGSNQLTASSPSPKIDAEVLLCFVLEKRKTYLIAHSDDVLNVSHWETFQKLIAQRVTGVPVAYLVGKREFWDLELYVNEHTLIPRPDTETLVEQVLELYPDATKKKALDLGTGTGAIALALGQEKKLWQITAVDNSASALDVAKQNSISNNVHNVEFILSDWFSALDQAETFDLIVSNPPYIDPQDEHLQQGDLRFEPISALIAEESGYKDYRCILEQALGFLNVGGYVIFEHGYDQGESLRKMMRSANLVDVQTKQDLGGNDRISFGRKN